MFKEHIIFRDEVKEIPSTTYGTFGIYKYPAKFIPQVIAYVLKTYAKPGMKIFDPFAGYGTVGVVSRAYGFDYELWDLNPLINIIHYTAIMKKPKVDLKKLMSGIKSSKKVFKPDWSNLEYWFLKDFLPVLYRSWGFVHSLPQETKSLLLIPLLKTTRYFSNSDEKIHKLYLSKFSRKKVNNLLKEDWKSKFYLMLEKEVTQLIRKLEEYNSLKPKSVNFKLQSGIDVLETKLDKNVDILITSPPYLQAQEYIRSTKLELFWLGHKEKEIRELSKKEIPYREVDRILICSDKYFEFRERIKEEHLRELYDRYFHSILNTFTRLGEKVRKYMFIFVGPAKIRTTPVSIDDIVIEHLTNFGWKHEITLVDKIVSRSMFSSSVNPASGQKDNRMQTEHLVVLKRD